MEFSLKLTFWNRKWRIIVRRHIANVGARLQHVHRKALDLHRAEDVVPAGHAGVDIAIGYTGYDVGHGFAMNELTPKWRSLRCAFQIFTMAHRAVLLKHQSRFGDTRVGDGFLLCRSAGRRDESRRKKKPRACEAQVCLVHG